VDVTDRVGLHFQHDAGTTGDYFMPQIMGSGGAVLDFDNDGRLDVYLVHNAGPQSGSRNQLFHHEPDGSFRDVSAGSGLDVAGYCMGVAVADVNNDGWVDVLLLEYGRVRLFLNQGMGKFSDITESAGLGNPAWASSAAFFDYDRDGWLDLVIVNYLHYDPAVRCTTAGGRPDYCHPSVFPGTIARLYRNATGKQGAPVRFADVTLSAGLGRLPGRGLGVTCADFDGDDWPDIFVANDSQANRLWLNRGNGTFAEEAVQRGVAFDGVGQARANMGVALGDVNRDGLFDIFVTHLTEEFHTLWVQRPAGIYRDRTAACGITAGRWRGTGFGTVLCDFDHDGWLDLALVNGRVTQRKTGERGIHFWDIYAERNQLFRGRPNGSFQDISQEQPNWSGRPGVYRGLICADLDNDGRPDLLVTQVAGPARVFRNVATPTGHWLRVSSLVPEQRRRAYGTVVTVHAGGQRWVGLCQPGFSYQVSNDPRVHFGLGDVSVVDFIEVLWPDGSRERFAGAVDREVVVEYGRGQRITREPTSRRSRPGSIASLRP